MPNWGYIFKKLGLSSLLGFVRFTTDGFPPFRDSSLLIQNQLFDEVPVRVYQRKKSTARQRKAVLFFHGGAGTFGSIDAYERICRYIAKETDSVVVSIGYGLGPENPYPNQYAECLKATVHLMKNLEDYSVDPSRIILTGDSCGANFATRICQLLVDRGELPKVHAQILIYPGLQAIDFSLPSYQQNCRVPILWGDLLIFFCCLFLNKNTSIVYDVLNNCHVPEDIRLKYKKWVNADLIPEEFKVRGYKPQDPALRKFKPKVYEDMKHVFEETFSPLLAEDAIISKMPQTCIMTCEFDVLRDDGLLYKRRLEDNGVPVKWFHIEDGIHGSAISFGYGFLCLPSAKQILNKVVEYIKSL
ncbi:arylacetamide deacetylase-like 3 [Hemicordylus capensis]|uniref:arylacetamide deacetylase-like 3 n=1 Tax=Hemicordylus capensis TaxID=884348 RepID=UPI002302EFE7|nr:arylacetamide deacetylase-like 3 [Hemicordylus capensis]